MSWFPALNQSFLQNRFLDHIHLMTGAVIIDSRASLFPVRFQGFAHESLIIFVDNRSHYFSCLLDQHSEFLWHFPITNEFFKFTALVSEEVSEEIRREKWNGLSQREKEGFCGLPPDISVNQVDRSDVDCFKPQEAKSVSRNFAVLKIAPTLVEHSIFLDKSAIGNTRKTYESLPQPDAISKKYLHTLSNSTWHLTELHLPIARP